MIELTSPSLVLPTAKVESSGHKLSRLTSFLPRKEAEFACFQFASYLWLVCQNWLTCLLHSGQFWLSNVLS